LIRASHDARPELWPQRRRDMLQRKLFGIPPDEKMMMPIFSPSLTSASTNAIARSTTDCFRIDAFLFREDC